MSALVFGARVLGACGGRSISYSSDEDEDDVYPPTLPVPADPPAEDPDGYATIGACPSGCREPCSFAGSVRLTRNDNGERAIDTPNDSDARSGKHAQSPSSGRSSGSRPRHLEPRLRIRRVAERASRSPYRWNPCACDGEADAGCPFTVVWGSAILEGHIAIGVSR